MHEARHVIYMQPLHAKKELINYRRILSPRYYITGFFQLERFC
jgi:hypothetical protein